MAGFKPNMKSQGHGYTAHRHNHQDQIHSKTHLEEQYLYVGTSAFAKIPI